MRCIVSVEKSLYCDGKLFKHSKKETYFDRLDSASDEFYDQIEAIEYAYSNPSNDMRYEFVIRLTDERSISCSKVLIFEK